MGHVFKGLAIVLRDNIITGQRNRTWSHGDRVKIFNVPVCTAGLLICRRKVHEDTTNCPGQVYCAMRFQTYDKGRRERSQQSLGKLTRKQQHVHK